MDTTGFFHYPGGAGAAAPSSPARASCGRDRGGWDACSSHGDAALPRRARTSCAQGERDRALYLLLDGRLEARPSGPVAPGQHVRRGRASSTAARAR